MNRIVFLPGGPGIDTRTLRGTYAGLKKPSQLTFHDSGISGACNMDLVDAEIHDRLQSYSKRAQFVLYGHSAGAIEALRYAQRHPDMMGSRVRGLIFESWPVDSSYAKMAAKMPTTDLPPPIPIDFERGTAGCFGSTDDDSFLTESRMRQFFAFGLPRAVTNDFLHKANDLLVYGIRVHPALMFGAQGSFFRPGFDLQDILTHLTVPVLSLAGTDDRVVPAEHIRNAINNARAENPNVRIEDVWFEGLRHMVSLERPDEARQRVKDFCRRAFA